MRRSAGEATQLFLLIKYILFNERNGSKQSIEVQLFARYFMYKNNPFKPTESKAIFMRYFFASTSYKIFDFICMFFIYLLGYSATVIDWQHWSEPEPCWPLAYK